MSVELCVILAILLVAVIAALWVQDLLRRKHLMLRVQKMYGSQLYQDIRPLLCAARYWDVESLSVDKTGIDVHFYNSEFGERAFMMRPNGYAYLTVDQQAALRVILEEHVPKLANAKQYKLRKYSVPLVTGEKEYGYRYSMTNRHRSELLEPIYFGTKANTNLW